MNKIDPVLYQLLTAFGPSNDVSEVTTVFQKYIRPYVSKVEKDSVGNLLATAQGNSKLPTLMYFGHADSIGFQVKYIDDRGFAFVSDITGLDAVNFSNLPGTGVQFRNRFTNKDVFGKFVHPVPLHYQDKEESPEARQRRIELNPIDLGLRSDIEAKKILNKLDYGVFLAKPELLGIGPENKQIRSASLDDRISLYTMYRVAKEVSKLPVNDRPTIMYCATFAEEVGGDIAASLFAKTRPDFAINIDVTPAVDSINDDNQDTLAKVYGTAALFKGPVLARGQGNSGEIFAHLEKIAIGMRKDEVQLECADNGTENSIAIKAGIPASVVLIPFRYAHTDYEQVALCDVEETIRLLYKFQKSIAKRKFP